MARIKIRYLVVHSGANGDLYYWQPSQNLRKLGWKVTRLRHPDGSPITNSTDAIAAAQACNAKLDLWRTSQPADQSETAGRESVDERPAQEMSRAPITGPAAPPQLAIPAAPPPVPENGTVDYVIRQYKASRFFRDRTRKTQGGYATNLRVISKWAGDSPIAAIDAPRINTFYEALRPRTPSTANAVVRMMRILFRFAIVAGLAKTNPARDVPISTIKPSGLIWPRPAVGHLVKTADRMGRWSIGTAIIIQHWIGQREGDLLSLERSRYRDGAFSVSQSKRGARVLVPHSPLVAARIEAELARQAARKVISTEATTLIISEETGRPYTESNFQHRFADIRDKAAETAPTFKTDYTLDIEGEEIDFIETKCLLFSWLRHTAVTELAIAGNDAPQISGVTGHSIQTCQNIIDRYMLPTGEMASAAINNRLAWERKMNESLNLNS